MPDKAVKSPSAKRKLEMGIEDVLFSPESSSHGERFRVNDNEPQNSRKRKERNWENFEIVDLEEVQGQTQLKDKTMWTSQPAIDDAKLNKVRRSKRFGSSLLGTSLNSLKGWSEDQELCLLNAILDTRTSQGEFNRAAFYQRARELLRIEVGNSVLYDKMRSMKRKYWSMVKERKEGKLVHQIAQNQTMFLLCEKMWGTMEAKNPLESENPDPEEKGIESSTPDAIEAENSNFLKEEVLNRNSAENSSFSREDTLNHDSVENLESRENMAVNTSIGEVSEFRENAAINAVNLESEFNSTVDLDSELNHTSAASSKHVENKAKQSLREETHGKDTGPNFTISPKQTENIAKGSRREETQGENSHLLEEPIHQETHMENARVNGLFVDRSPREDIHVENARKSGHAIDGYEFPEIQLRGLESRIEALIENSIKGIETRLEASIQSSFDRVVTGAPTTNLHSLEEFCGEVMKGNGALSNAARTMKELMHGVNSVDEFPSLDIGETCQMQQQWRKIKLQLLKTFSEGMELLINQCKLLMKSGET